jgi:hypothetical protein
MARSILQANLFPLRRLLLVSLATISLIVMGMRGETVAATAKQKSFKSPDRAVAALVKATRDNNVKELLALFGPGSESLVSSGDEVEDRRHREQFVKAYGEKNRIEAGAGGIAVLYIGNDDWPFPIPVVKSGSRWQFDTGAGRDEILNREVGENELSAIQVCLAIADAQRDYADQMRDRTGHPEYAQKLESKEGTKDGLYWEAAQGETPSPLGPLAARARAEGYGQPGGIPTPYHGYLYKILTAQGTEAAGGAYDYLVDGKMIGGFALLAYPAVYGSSGVSSFIVSHDGAVYRKDLGINTARDATSLTTFNPDKTWNKVE